MASAAFSQWECEVVLYRADEQGRSTGEVEWLGGCENKMQIGQGYAEERADRSGDPYARNQQLEEVHTIELEALWLSRYESAGVIRNPVLARNQRFVAVLVWIDDETGVWHKRSYFGVEIGELSLSSENEYFTQRTPMRAGWFVPQNGRLPEMPGLLPAGGGIVRYFSSGAAVDLFSYDFGTEQFTELSPSAGKFTIAGAGGGYVLRLLVGGVVALGIGSDGVAHVAALIASGGSYASGLPRVEFFNGSLRVATLTAAGVLAVPSFFETATAPALTEDFVFSDGAWRLSFGNAGAYAPAIEDDL